MRNIVNGLLIKDNQVLLAYRSPQRDFYPDCWSLPGGHVEAGEEKTSALARELQEEIAVTPTSYELVEQFTTDPVSNSARATFHIYLVSDWLGKPTLQGDEHTEFRWFPVNDAAELTSLALAEYATLLRRLVKSE